MHLDCELVCRDRRAFVRPQTNNRSLWLTQHVGIYADHRSTHAIKLRGAIAVLETGLTRFRTDSKSDNDA